MLSQNLKKSNSSRSFSVAVIVLCRETSFDRRRNRRSDCMEAENKCPISAPLPEKQKLPNANILNSPNYSFPLAEYLGLLKKYRKSYRGKFVWDYFLPSNSYRTDCIFDLGKVRSQDSWFHPLPMTMLFLFHTAFPGAYRIQQ